MEPLLAQITNPVILPSLGAGEQGGVSIAILMARLFRTILVVGGIALLLYLAWGGLSWITAGADKNKLEEAKTRIENALMGMAVLAGTIAIALFLQWTFGFDLLNPTLPDTP
jgi:arginine exporter protein ArgO